VVPFAEAIISLLLSKETKTRWEAAHALSLIADKIPEIVFTLLPDLREMIERDKSTIVRDYSVDIVANYAKTGKDASEKAFGILKAVLDIWDEKHARQVFKGFNAILDHQPAYKAEIGRIVNPYLEAKKNVVVKEARKIMKRC